MMNFWLPAFPIGSYINRREILFQKRVFLFSVPMQLKIYPSFRSKNPALYNIWIFSRKRAFFRLVYIKFPHFNANDNIIIESNFQKESNKINMERKSSRTQTKRKLLALF
jgi:hypothetical protein